MSVELPGNTTRPPRQESVPAYRQGVAVEGFAPTVVFAEARTRGPVGRLEVGQEMVQLTPLSVKSAGVLVLPV